MSELIPIGDYLAKAVSGRYITASTGSDGAEVICQIVGGPNDGRVVSWTSFFGADKSEKQAERIYKQLMIAGARIVNNDLDMSTIGTTQFRISVIHERVPAKDDKPEYTIAKVDWINQGSNFQTADPTKVAAMKSRFAGVLAKLGASQPQAEQPKNDNIPF